MHQCMWRSRLDIQSHSSPSMRFGSSWAGCGPLLRLTLCPATRSGLDQPGRSANENGGRDKHLAGLNAPLTSRVAGGSCTFTLSPSLTALRLFCQCPCYENDGWLVCIAKLSSYKTTPTEAPSSATRVFLPLHTHGVAHRSIRPITP